MSMKVDSVTVLLLGVLLIGLVFSFNCSSVGVYLFLEVTSVDCVLVLRMSVKFLTATVLLLGPRLPILWGEFVGDEDIFFHTVTGYGALIVSFGPNVGGVSKQIREWLCNLNS